MKLHAVVLAAGKGTRMRSLLPKVLQPIGGTTLLQESIRAFQSLRESQDGLLTLVVGHGADQVKQALPQLDCNWVSQHEQLGTGHAVAQAVPLFGDDDLVVVLCGDVPLLSKETLARLIDAAGSASPALLTVVLEDPSGYGRVLRDSAGNVAAIVEQKDGNDEQLRVKEINTGIMAIPAGPLKQWLSRLGNDNAQGEYYLTDVIAMAVADGYAVTAVNADNAAEVAGVNDKRQLAEAERVLQLDYAQQLLKQGVTLRDPARFDLRGELQVGSDVEVDINAVFEGQVTLGDGVKIGANCQIRNSTLGPGTIVLPNTLIDSARIGGNCQIGPFARIRPDSELADNARVGNFVELKKTHLGPGSKANHLSYIGDAIVGADVNIGAGVITCNYDGANKHLTEIGDGAFIGSDCQLVAPVKVGPGATIGAGTTLTREAAAGELTLSRVKQVTLKGWQAPVKKSKQ
ncbi:MAG: bifunctional UDP-N-acetylglucosamine diphosphorylase/glucosamine-1-phosphate N-acetyltransferase GlmU [Immundisolibacteraceae bacterium]|nr:bifunctional UDP-N-acetylglucosamine diphosphorylase/glucosamine-1-phosphate N-acetyltransferase GlmU [Immundisolibacteraceae bacterium]